MTHKEASYWLSLLTKLNKWSISHLTGGYRKRTHYDVLLDHDTYREIRASLKAKYANHWVQAWPEKTDAQKFIPEDISIASWLLGIWQRYPSERSFPTKYVDLGCGNGFLVHLLTSEGIPGYGIDQSERKVWSLYGPTTHLEAQTLSPPTTHFASAEWLVGNHADELIPWIPIMAARSGIYHSKIILIPCCRYDLAGRKFTRTRPGQTRFQTYVDYVKDIMTQCGYEISTENLRIPSTKDIALVGMRRTFAPSK
ncbi:hypothetical protein BJ085DRAFT_17949 [Dimargaris cristalligena]|uniref:tRNA (uracil-O(2)-)-methyltransferase n=1 Tax=Dimargaris cristalligena TaxID=215637 RepID=A0A4Q0A0Q3_9FUNG|nr:hypothetical protein BJ085DRAFT_17949 [Dimargaris cristalligena]|eukprot:RKP38852.1 hypothetical protein BJ085DRAFT_17949 [Dimargaris cristalligena]